MKPKLKTTKDWEQAELLMQPALIRTIDHLRQKLETVNWESTYREIDTPFPGHELCLTKGNDTVVINIWDLCFQACFLNYPPLFEELTVEVDPRLIDDTGDVDWEILDDKVKQLVERIFANLP